MATKTSRFGTMKSESSLDEFLNNIYEAKLSRQDVIDFFKKNHNPTDAQVHAWASENGFDIHKVEAMAYELASKYVRTVEENETE